MMVLLSGCLKTGTEVNITYLRLNAIVNGDSFNSVCRCTHNGVELTISGGNLENGVLTAPSIYINVEYSGLGTYPIGYRGAGVNQAFYDSAGGGTTQSCYGNVTITGTSPLKGTFSYTCTDSTKVTNRSFVGKNPF